MKNHKIIQSFLRHSQTKVGFNPFDMNIHLSYFVAGITIISLAMIQTSFSAEDKF